MRSTLLIAISFAALTQLACRPKCNPNTDVPHCEGSVLMTCPQPGVDQLVGANQWVSRNCSDDQKVCVESSGTAFCALSATPSQSCPDGGSEACDASTEVFCEQGFETARFDCLSCSAPSDGGPVDCAGGPGATCSHDVDCRAPLVCQSGFCEGAR